MSSLRDLLRPSLRWKLMMVSMTVVFIPVYLLNRQALRTLDRFTSKVWEDEMAHTSRVIGRVCVEWADQNPEVVLDLMRRTQEDTHIRLRWITPDGKVRFDSDTSVTNETSSIWAPGPEVAVAMTGKYKARWATTPDHQLNYYYTAQPVLVEGQVVGVVHATRHTNPIVIQVMRMLNHQRKATWIAVGSAAAISALLAWTLTRRLRRLTASAAAHSRGENHGRFALAGNDEIAELSRSFDHLTESLAARNRYNRDFVATTLHELRTPITAIRGAADLLQGSAGEKPDAREKFLGHIRHHADRLGRLVGELGELTRVDTGSDEDYPRTEGDLHAALERIVDRAETAFAAPRARLLRDWEPEPLVARFNEERIEQALLNLLDNAFRYTPATGTVTISLRSTGQGVEIMVEDTGRGIAANDLPHIFDRFFTTEAPDPGREYGTGIGLAVARAIARQHGGDIRAESEPGRGTRMRFSM
jgi:signal transduction histidine kinase